MINEKKLVELIDNEKVIGSIPEYHNKYETRHRVWKRVKQLIEEAKTL